MNVQTVQGGNQAFQVNPVAVCNHPVFQGEQGDPAVQGAGVQIQKIKLLRNQFGESAFAGRRITVNGDDDIGDLHSVMH